MDGTFIFLLIALVIGEIICGAIIKAINKDDPFFGKIGRAGFNLVAGFIFCEVVPYLFEDMDDFVESTYWVGQLLFIVGITSFLFALFEVLKSIEHKLSKIAPESKTPAISEKKGRSDAPAEASAKESTPSNPVTAVKTYTCSECGSTVSKIPCPSCGNIAYPVKPVDIDNYIIACPVCSRRQQNNRTFCISCSVPFINGLGNIPYWCEECGMPGPFSDGKCPHCSSDKTILNKKEN